MSDQSTYDENLRIYKEELRLTYSILKVNRHNSATGEWYGPHRPASQAGPDCKCAGCEARYRER